MNGKRVVALNVITQAGWVRIIFAKIWQSRSLKRASFVPVGILTEAKDENAQTLCYPSSGDLG